MKCKKVHKIIIFLLFLVLLGMGWVALSSLRIFREVYKFRYIECGPDELLPDLERVFDINFPGEIRQVKTARTQGSWDSTRNNFIVKFSCKPSILGAFLGSFPKKIMFYPYEPKSDVRNPRALLPPQWFTDVIQRGKEGVYRADEERMQVYIDNTCKTNFVVYLKGSYYPNQ